MVSGEAQEPVGTRSLARGGLAGRRGPDGLRGRETRFTRRTGYGPIAAAAARIFGSKAARAGTGRHAFGLGGRALSTA